MTTGQTPISFTEEDLALFSEASGDRNPLHLNKEYASRTPYGQPVVFGCLGAVACLGRIGLPAGFSATSLDAEFLRPMFVGVAYRFEGWEKKSTWRGRLFDGTVPVLSITVKGQPTDMEEAMGDAPRFERREAAVWDQEDLVPGLTISGTYGCDAESLAARWRADPFLTKVLAWSSYLVGMELPGESALFSRLVLNFHGTRPAPLLYQASIAAIDSRFGQIRIDVSLPAVASGQCWSYVRAPVPEMDDVDCAELRRDSLAGRAAVVLGSSRGLGAAMKHALELRGAIVYGMARSADAGVEVGDAADPVALRRLQERVSKEHGRLDFLICNACPPILPLRLEPNGAARIADYINQAVSLTLAPLTEFLELLNSGDGCAVIVSSAAVEQPEREWPHYVAAKQAVEALGRVAALQYPRVRTLIVRPQKLLTTMTNTPMGRMGAASPGLIANRIAERLENPPAPGTAEILV